MGMRKTCWAGPVGVPFEVSMAVSRLRWLCFLFLLSLAVGAGSKKDEKKKKSVLDLSERDVHRIYEQWEVSNLSVYVASPVVYIIVPLQENDEDSDDEDYDDFDPRKRPSGLCTNIKLKKNVWNVLQHWDCGAGPPIDIEKLQSGGKIDPQQILEQSKKGKPLMIFVGVKSPPNEQYTDQVSRLWAQSLMNAHIPVERSVSPISQIGFLFLVENAM